MVRREPITHNAVREKAMAKRRAEKKAAVEKLRKQLRTIRRDAANDTPARRAAQKKAEVAARKRAERAAAAADRRAARAIATAERRAARKAAACVAASKDARNKMFHLVPSGVALQKMTASDHVALKKRVVKSLGVMKRHSKKCST